MAVLVKGFHYTDAIRAVCDDLVERLAELHHIRMPEVAVGFYQARKQVSHGLQASLTPLRFEGGAVTTVIRRRRYACQRIFAPSGTEYLYLLGFYLPRFQNHSLEEKLTTIVHELWHIAPEFNGDIRRHDGRCFAHGRSQEEFDAHAAGLAKRWLSLGPPADSFAFLNLSFAELQRVHGRVIGQRFAKPRLLPLAG